MSDDKDILDTPSPAASDTSSSAPDTGNAAASTDASQSSSAPAPGTEQSNGSLDQTAQQTGEKTVAESSQASEQIPNLEKRWKDTQAWATKTNQEKLELQRQFAELQAQHQQMQRHYAGIAPSDVEQWKSQQALKPWDEGSPNHAAFLETVQEARIHERLIQRTADPEQRKILSQLAMEELGPEKLKLLESWREDVRRQENERQLNPKAYYAKLIREQAQPVVRETLQSSNQQYQQAMQGREAAQKWMANTEIATPENIQLVVKYMAEQSMPFDVASALVERDHYRKQISQATKAKQSADEKERILQGNAAGGVSRNPSASKALDIGKHLKEKGLSGRNMIDELFDLDRQGLLNRNT